MFRHLLQTVSRFDQLSGKHYKTLYNTRFQPVLCFPLDGLHGYTRRAIRVQTSQRRAHRYPDILVVLSPNPSIRTIQEQQQKSNHLHASPVAHCPVGNRLSDREIRGSLQGRKPS